MKNITYRSNLMDEVNITGNVEYDLGSIDFGNFEFGENSYYLVREEEVYRPDIISQRLYGTTNYWWFIMWYNGISDIWNDLRAGLVLKYPNIELVRQAIKLYTKTK